MNSQRVNLAFSNSDRFGAKTMGQPQPERHAAAQAFIESLAQLEQTFEPIESVEEPALQAPETPDASQKLHRKLLSLV